MFISSRVKESQTSITLKVNEIVKDLSGLRIKVDDREEYTAGWKFNQWEMKGVPIE